VELRVASPFPTESLPRVWRWIEPFRQRVADDFAPQTLETFVEQTAAQWEGQRTWAVYGDDELGGVITFERISPWLGTAHVILKPDFQGRGLAVEACQRAVVQMFELGVGKLAFYPLAHNRAIGSLLVTLGARREGKLVAHTLCAGKPTDIWVYGLTQEAFDAHRRAVAA
jgi:RimJ/RimL family protein N-acetyltransferase